MRILVCGGRNFSNKERLEYILSHTIWWEIITCLIHGGAKGADSLAGEWAERIGIKVEVYPADWDKFGKAAGGIRNQQMLDEGDPDLVIAFPGGSGTADMIRRSRKAGIEVLQVVT